MFKKFLMTLLLILSFSLVWAGPTKNEFSKFTFPAVTTALEDVFEEIRSLIKTSNLLPFTKEKEAKLTNDVTVIIVKHELNKNICLRNYL